MKIASPIGWVLLLALGVFGGCGVGDHSINSGATQQERGSLLLSVTWPTPSRLIPLASKSIRFTLTSNDDIVRTQVVSRPASGQTTSVTLNGLPLIPLLVMATAYPNEDGTGTAQASGNMQVKISATEMATASINMNSTIAKVLVVPNTRQVAPLVAFALVVVAFDNKDKPVLCSDANWTWTSDNTSVATVVGRGGVAVVSTSTQGIAHITAQEKDSMQKSSCTITVGSN